jgi:phosphotransacetylase
VVACDGFELQLDAALDPAVYAAKVGQGGLAGKANVLVFPSLEAGNIAYKTLSTLSQATTAGPLLLGAGRPYSDLSRGAKAEDIVAAAILTLARGGSAGEQPKW